MPELSSATLVLLVALAFGAGLVSSMAGAGGLITLPALLWAGLPPLFALGTNKVQSALGTLASTLNYARSGHLQWSAVRRGLAGAAAGAALGALAVQRLSNALLEAMLPLLLMAMALYFLVSPRVGDEETPARVGAGLFDGAVAPAMGFYGGFFGPGMGSILPFLLVSLRGCDLRRATAHTKALVLVINGVAALLFAGSGRVAWGLALAMAGAQMLGAGLGSGLVIRRGARLVQPVIVAVTLAVAVHLLWTR
ncbi:MAG: TSUP family transporter [Pseudomonadota bacterium]